MSSNEALSKCINVSSCNTEYSVRHPISDRTAGEPYFSVGGWRTSFSISPKTQTSMACERLANTLRRTLSSIQAAISGGRVMDHCSRILGILSYCNVSQEHLNECNTLRWLVGCNPTQAPPMMSVPRLQNKKFTILNSFRDAPAEWWGCVSACVCACARVPVLRSETSVSAKIVRESGQVKNRGSDISKRCWIGSKMIDERADSLEVLATSAPVNVRSRPYF